jgi:FkbM family methyltransferase
MPINRKRFLENACWTTAGTAFGFLGRSAMLASPRNSSSPPVNLGPVRPSAPAPEANPSATPVIGLESFSQAGEDLSVRFILYHRGIAKMTYLDIGANDPIELNNTYFFYRAGYRGVLVEPNPAFGERLKSVRPNDTTLVAGIGVTADREADFYVLSSPALSTFSKEQAEQAAKSLPGNAAIKEVIKVPLLNINNVMELHFGGAPTFVSIDTEGMDLPILKTIDFDRFRPKIICAETLAVGTTKVIPEIAEFMATQGYVVRGGSLVNTIFIDSKIL